jgi:hypothetical protein
MKEGMGRKYPKRCSAMWIPFSYSFFLSSTAIYYSFPALSTAIYYSFPALSTGISYSFLLSSSVLDATHEDPDVAFASFGK